MFRMNSFISRFCVQCCAVSMRNRTNHLLISPIAAYDYAKRYKSFSNEDLSKSMDANLGDDFDYESESPYSNIDLEAVSEGDATKLKALKVLQLEIDLMRQQGGRVPSNLSPQRWKELLTYDIPVQRAKYLRHLWVVERKQNNRREKSQKKAESYAEHKARVEEAGLILRTTCSPLNYQLCDTTLFHRLRLSTMNQFFNYRLLLAEWFGPKVLVDCSYEQFMELKNLQSCVKQMLLMWSDNRESSNPYDLIYCNVDQGSSLWQKFIQRIPMINDADSPVHFTQQHYLDMFPRNKLVYLTPHCNEILEHYSHDDIYIIGAYVDANQCQPLSLAKAKKENLRMAKLPLDKYLQWAVGHKSLPLNQVLAILNDLKDGLSWQKALKHVPGRKIVSIKSSFQARDEKENLRTAKGIRQEYRKNLVYDLLLNDRPTKSSKKR